MRIPRSLLVGAGLVAASVGLLASPASAHVGIQEGDQVAGAYTVLTFGVPHGCDGSPTTEVAISIPESILNVTPTRNPYYDVAVETEALAEPVEGAHGETVTERESVVTYTAKEPLADGVRDALEISLQIPEDAAGTTLYFPTVQTCEAGETAWIEIPEEGQDGHELEAPAPAVNVVEGEGDGHGHDAAGAEDDKAAETDDGAAEGEQVSTDGAGEGEVAAPVSEDDDGTDPLTVVALVLAVLGLGVGGAGFVAARKSAA